MTDPKLFKRAASFVFNVVVLPVLACVLLYLFLKNHSAVTKPAPSYANHEQPESTNPPLGHKMAWRSSGSSNAALIANLATNGLIKNDRVKEAMLKVDRAHYSPYSPYYDSPQSIGWQATISAPHMHASAAESLLPFLHPAARILDIGSGSGYLTHVLANLVGPQGRVVGIDHIAGLVELSRKNMAKSQDGKEMLDSGKVKLIVGDGRKGCKDDGPYDAIHVGAAAKEAHQDLLEQLKAPGRLFIPVGERYGQQYIYVIDKAEDGSIKRSKEYGVSYVPLTDYDPTISE